jgi:outer membrane autotransporter protein
VPAGFTGLRLVAAGGSAGLVTNFTVFCTAAPDPVVPPDPEDEDEVVADVGTDPGQASRLVTVQTSTAAVASFSSFINSAVARRLGAGPAAPAGTVAESLPGATGVPGGILAGGAPTGEGPAGPGRVPTQVASLLPVGQLMGAATSAIDGGSLTPLAVAGAQLADNALAAADRPFGLWISGAATFLDNHADGGQYAGEVLSLAGGADHAISETLLVGVALGYERGDINTTFNAGDLVSNGFTAAPYAGWQPIPELVLDATVGVTFLDYDLSRAAGAVEGAFDATRAFGAINATGIFRFDRLRLSPLAGVLYFREMQDGYTDSAGTVVDGQTIDLGRLTAGVEAGYGIPLGERLVLEPYARLEGEFDFIEADAVTLTTGERFRPGRYGGSVAGGLNLISGQGFAGTIEASYDAIGRDDFDSVTVQGTLRFAF